MRTRLRTRPRRAGHGSRSWRHRCGRQHWPIGWVWLRTFWRPSACSPASLCMLVGFLLAAALLGLLILGARAFNDFADRALARGRLEPLDARLRAVGLEHSYHVVLLTHRLVQSGQKSLIVAQPRYADTGGGPLLKHALILDQIAPQFSGTPLRILQARLNPGHARCASAFLAVSHVTDGLQAFGSLHFHSGLIW